MRGHLPWGSVGLMGGEQCCEYPYDKCDGRNDIRARWLNRRYRKHVQSVCPPQWRDADAF